MSAECPHCGHQLDHSEPRPWHSMQYGEDIEAECDGCGKPIAITADICWEVTSADDCGRKLIARHHGRPVDYDRD